MCIRDSIIALPKQDVKLLGLNEAVESAKAGKVTQRLTAIKEVIDGGNSVITFDRELGEHDMIGIVGVYRGRISTKPSIYDITPSILKYFGIEVPNYVDGKPIIEFNI